MFFLLVSETKAVPSPSATSAILIEAESGRVLFEKAADQEMKIASITKILTAHVALQHASLQDKVKISAKAAATEGSSLYLPAGSKVTMEDLLYGLLLRSGNDAAVAIAEHVSGSVEDFSVLMNNEAKKLGMTHSHFTNPHGLDLDDQHYSSARDMAMLTKEAIKNHDFSKIFSSEKYRAELNGNPALWHNKHRLVTGLYPYASGGKTGYTKKAGRTLVTSAKRDNMTLIAVTIQASDDWNDHIHMFEHGFSTYKNVPLLEKGELPPYADQSEDVILVNKNHFSYPLAKHEKDKVSFILNPQNATLKVQLQNRTIHTEQLEEKSVKEKNWFQKLIQRIAGGFNG
ncbi:D-alanyl-D-alanine carboxypeptidase family protein [Jeotgalibacillus aurantiacus]|uniref:D-alanyl-D-alanine carboxypeptidase family protein n=1 Tax=Jeotgalibacillus aurantiacus TaxID=2763266 RepID=UPI001D0BD1AF|nr:D-alanyl-D-alanine carboxypeptidase family protein [Jeotgalibacillus aurantiacus]